MSLVSRICDHFTECLVDLGQLQTSAQTLDYTRRCEASVEGELMCVRAVRTNANYPSCVNAIESTPCVVHIQGAQAALELPMPSSCKGAFSSL